MPYANNFCAAVNRLRVSAEAAVNWLPLLRKLVSIYDQHCYSQPATELIERLHGQLAQKKETHYLHQGITGVTQHLAFTVARPI